MLGRLLVAVAVAVLGSTIGALAITITSSTTDVKKLEGESMLLSCTFSANTSWSDRAWTAPLAEALLEGLQHERMNVTYDSGSRTSYLSVTGLTVADSGNYECQVTSKHLRYKLSVVVNKYPESVVITGGKEISLTKDVDNNVTCTVKNIKPPANVVWTNAVAGAVVGPLFTASTASADNSLLFNTVSVMTVKPTETSRVNYTCKVVNPEFGGLTFESSVTAEVLHAPVISSMHNEPVATKYREHGSVKLTCLVSTSNPPAVTWRWFQGGALLADITTASYTIADIPSTLHGLQVICEATNSIGAMNFSYPFIVEYGPRLKKPLENIEVNLGEPQTFLCDIDSNPAPSIYWRKMATSDVVKTEKTLSFASIKDSDIGGYTCIASVDGFQDVLHADAYLLLIAPPTIAGEEDYFVSHGEDAEIVCLATSIPKESTTFTWTKGRNGIPVDLSKKDKYVETVTATIHGKRSTLTIKEVTSDDFVTYNCTVTNSKGSFAKAFRIQQRDDFPWQYAVIGVGSGLGLILVITLIVCLVKRRRSKSKSAANDSGSASVVSQTTENSIRKPYGYMPNYGTGYAAPGTWISDQFHNPDGYDHEGYPLRMDMGYDTMDAAAEQRGVQPEAYQTFPGRRDTFYASYARGQTQQASNGDAAFAPLMPGRDQGFYSTYAGSMRAPGHYGNSVEPYFEASPYDVHTMPDIYGAGRPLHVDLPAATEASHLATNV